MAASRHLVIEALCVLGAASQLDSHIDATGSDLDRAEVQQQGIVFPGVVGEFGSLIEMIVRVAGPVLARVMATGRFGDRQVPHRLVGLAARRASLPR